MSAHAYLAADVRDYDTTFWTGRVLLPEAPAVIHPATSPRYHWA